MSDQENALPVIQTENRTTRWERTSYALYFVGQNVFYMLLLQFLSPFFTDIGIPAAVAAVIALIVKVWDAVNDPIFGGIVDRTRFKKGKFLPWVKISVVVIPITTAFLFAAPSSAGLTAKIVWVTIGYMLWDLAYNICDVPIFGMLTTMTDHQPEKTTLITLGRIAAMLAMFGVGVALPVFREAIGGWFPTVMIISIIAFLTMIPICFSGKERFTPPPGEEEIGLKQMFSFVAHNKYMLLFLLSNIVNSVFAVNTNLGLYLARYNLGGEGMLSLLYIVSFVPMVAVIPFIPLLNKRFDKYHLFMFAVFGGAAIGLVQYFLGYHNLMFFMILSFLRGILSALPATITFMFTPDITEYGIWKTGVRAVGISFSIQAFTSKITAAISTATGLFVLSLIGFIEGEGAPQAAGFPDKLWLIFTLVPVFGGIAQGIILFKYKLRDKDVAIMTQANVGNITHEESEKLLGGRF